MSYARAMVTNLAAPGRVSAEECRLDDLRSVVEVTIDPADYPMAASVEGGVIAYDRDAVAEATGAGRQRLLAEIALALSEGPGIVRFAEAVDHAALDEARVVFEEIIEEQRDSDGPAGDHFAKPGANDRIWNALEKLALRAPQAFHDYYRSPAIATAAEAWLGPGYQVTSQVNVVNPGGESQNPHRDYHLGFMTDAQAERYPMHVHLLSPALTLQGAVAHSDMPVETGPTMYLPHSQKYPLGYLAWRRDDVRAYFAEHHIQPSLAKGDAAFFNPAVFHGAGTNRTTDVLRMANLLQISSAFGRAMESIDRKAMAVALFPVLKAALEAGDTGDDATDRTAAEDVDRVVAASAEAYPFPTDLDRDQPVDGLAPPAQADLLRSAVGEGWSAERLAEALDHHASIRGEVAG